MASSGSTLVPIGGCAEKFYRWLRFIKAVSENTSQFYFDAVAAVVKEKTYMTALLVFRLLVCSLFVTLRFIICCSCCVGFVCGGDPYLFL